MTEIWKDVVGYEEYFQVSNTGKIFSKRTNKELKLRANHKGYPVFATKFGGRNGTDMCFRVHILVAKAFIDNPDNKPTVNHIDGNKLNNHVNNLEWSTYSEQLLHAHASGLKVNKQGEEAYQSKLTEEDVKFVRNVHKPYHPEYSCAALARKYNIQPSTMQQILKNGSYKNVK